MFKRSTIAFKARKLQVIDLKLNSNPHNKSNNKKQLENGQINMQKIM